MARQLKNKKRRISPGRAVRLSNVVIEHLERSGRGLRSYDAMLRRMLGLDDWRGNPQPLVEGCLEPTTGRFFIKHKDWDQAEEDAYEVAILEAAKKKTRKVNKPIRLREIR